MWIILFVLAPLLMLASIGDGLGPTCQPNFTQQKLVQSTILGFFCAAIAGGNENKGTEIGAPSPVSTHREGVGWGRLIIYGLSLCPSLTGDLTWMGD